MTDRSGAARPTAASHLGRALLGLLILVGTAYGQTVELTLSSTTLTFPSEDPDFVPLVPAQPLLVTYRVRQNRRGAWRLTVLAGGDLVAGSATIPITNVRWTATPAPPFQNGTLDKTVEQLVASGVGDVNPAQTGTILFHLVNLWSYSTGLYTQTLVFTLSAP
jgi:hypothetical protein